MSEPVRPPKHVLCEKEQPASLLIAELLGQDRERAQELMAFGGVYLNKKRLWEDRQLAAGDYLRVHVNPRRFPAERIDWKTCLVFESADFVVVNKPPTIPVHPTCDNAQENVRVQMEKVLGYGLKVTQRLDIPTQGLLVFARTSEFQSRFGRLLEKRKVIKKYRSLVEKDVATGFVTHYMEPGERAPKVLSEENGTGRKVCSLKILSCCRYLETNYSQLEILLLTGRTHQIRCQLAFLGAPVLGDELYGSPSSVPPTLGEGEVIALQSYHLEFPKKTGGHWQFSLPSPW